MKSNNPLIKNFGYMTIILAFLISVHLLITISSETENKIINNLNNNEKKFISLNKSKQTVEILEKNFTNFYYIIDILFKCGLAFLLGSLISERKFINIGKI